VDLNLVRREGTVDLWLELEDVKKGAIHLKLNWLGFSENPADMKAALIESQNFGLASCLLTVRLDSAKNLPTVREGSKPTPYVILSVGKVQYESSEKDKTSDPVYEETFHFLVRNPLTDTLLVKVVDKKTGADLGALKQSLDLVYHRPEMKMEKQNFGLNTKSEAKIALKMDIAVLKLGPAKGHGDDEDDAVASGSGVHPVEPAGSSSGGGGGSVSRVHSSTVPEPTPSNGNERPSSLVIEAGSTAGDEVIGLEVGEPESIRREESAPLLSSAPKTDEPTDMKVRLTIRYSQNTHQLVVVVHSVSNLPIEKEELPDPYVKLYVLPDKTKKHKTEAKKDNCNPLYDERFEFPVIDLRGKTLHVQVCDKKYIRSSPRLGEVYVALDDFQLGNVVTSWYPLTP